MGFSRLWFGLLPGVSLNGSVGYIPAALALLAVGALCRAAGEKAAARALLAAAGLFVLSLVFRSMDAASCSTLPVGTHFLWHGLNGLVLAVLLRAAILHERSPHAPD